MNKLNCNNEEILKAFLNMGPGQRLAYLFEDSNTVISNPTNYELVRLELYDVDNVLVAAAIVDDGEDFTFYDNDIHLKNAVPTEDFICQHEWYDGGKNSTIQYSKCTKCGETFYYGSD